jgi:lysine decarboxylase
MAERQPVSGTPSGPAAIDPAQREAPYLDALQDYAERGPARLHVPGHKGGPGADPQLAAALGERAFQMDVPSLTYGIDIGPRPTPFDQAQTLAAGAWGAKRAWFLINGASQGNLVAGLALAHAGAEIIVQRNAHSSTIDALILSGMRPKFVAPELDPELQIAHCITPQTLERALDGTPGAAGASVVSPTYFGAVADIRGLADVAHARGIPLVVDEAWGGHLAFHDRLPAHALSLGADLVVSSTHKVVGSLTQSAMLHLGWESEGRLDEHVVDRAVTLVESTSPSSLLTASLDAQRRFAAWHGPELLEETMQAMAATRQAVREIDGLDVLDERFVGRPGVFDYDPLRLAVDVRGTGATGYQLATLLREIADVNLELAGENVIVGVFGMGERALESGRRLVAALRIAVERLQEGPHTHLSQARAEFAPPPPWGELVMGPREAFFAPQEVVPVAEAIGRVASESLAAYPPGIPNVLPGERLTAETLDYIQQTLELGGHRRRLLGRAAGCDRRIHVRDRLRRARVRVQDPQLQGGDAPRQGGSRRRQGTRRGSGAGGRLAAGAEALARLAHERHGLREQHAHRLAQLGRLLLGVALEVQPRDPGDGHLDRELDRVVGPRNLLGALHLLCELAHPAPELVRVAEEAEGIL